MTQRKRIGKVNLLAKLAEMKREATKEYKERESNCQCSGDGDDYAKYGAQLCESEGTIFAIETIIDIVKDCEKI